MEKKTKIKGLIALSCSLAFLSYCSYDPDYNPQYSIIDEEDKPFGTYSNGNVYIGSPEYIHNVKQYAHPNDILIIVGEENNRGPDDPYAKILSSYRIEDREDRLEILYVLESYSKLHGTDWHRTIGSMRVEWEVHNFLYNINYEVERTQDVDFNNSEEDLYSNFLLQKLIK